MSLRTRKNGRHRYWQQVRELADELDIPVSAAREQWKDHYKPGGIKRVVLALNKLTQKITGSSVSICPFCRDDLIEGEEYHLCSGCATSFHQECFDEFGKKCTTLGCSGRGTKTKTNNRNSTIRISIGGGSNAGPNQSWFSRLRDWLRPYRRGARGGPVLMVVTLIIVLLVSLVWAII